jgi:hypothetical protein
MCDRIIFGFLLVFLILSISTQTAFENAFGQITVSGEPNGSRVLHQGEIIEVGLKLKAGTNIQYMMKADAFLYFDIHSHDGNQITTHAVLESRVFEGTFVAPKDADYYFMSMNMGESEVNLMYNISIGEAKHPVVYENTQYDVTTVSNSNIDFLGFSQENKQILIMMETPYLTPGFLQVTIPRSLLDGPFDVKGVITEYNYTQNESSSVFVIKTNNGKNDASIIGTTVVPEFPVPIILLTLALSSLILYMRVR